jgi:hypothetical protein
MVKKAEARRGFKQKKQVGPRREKIEATIAELEQIKPASSKTAEAIKLFKSWLADESGYDEKVWPRLKSALEKERRRVGARSLFGG